jgi:hypothetical protein
MAADVVASSRRWQELTRDAAPLLKDRTCIVIAGDRDEDAANVALALAHAHVSTRRVAIVDAVGELDPLQRLLPHDARPHGVLDHFLHGVSLRKIAHAVNRDGTLFILPSGVGPFEYDTLLRRERWRRLIMAFRAEGALLCIVLPHDAAGLAAFVEDTDGIVLVGDIEYPESRHVIARIPGGRRSSADAIVAPAAPPARRRAFASWTREARPTRAALLAAAVVAAVSVGAILMWNRRTGATEPTGQSETAIAPARTEAAVAGAVALSETDSANAAAYAVDIVMVNNVADAGRQLREQLRTMPAATFSPVHLGADSARWYRVLVGAWGDERQADSALLALRDAGTLAMGFGSVRRTPYAVRIADDMTPAAAIARAMELRSQGLPAYVLERDEGHAAVYAGAFETPSQAVHLLDIFRRAGIDAAVAYRIGRGI